MENKKIKEKIFKKGFIKIYCLEVIKIGVEFGL